MRGTLVKDPMIIITIITLLCLPFLGNMYSTVVDNRVAPSITAQTSNMKVELGSKVTLSCTASGNPTPTIHWYKDGKPIEGPQAIGNAFVIPEVTPRERGYYQCEAVSSYGNPSRSAETEILIQGLKIHSV